MVFPTPQANSGRLERLRLAENLGGTVPRSDGNTKRLTKSAKKRYNQATMQRRQVSQPRTRGNAGNSR